MSKPVIAYIVPTITALRDTLSNKWSYINVLNQIVIPKGQEGIYQTYYICGKINDGLGGDADVAISVKTPSGKVIATSKMTGKVEKGDIEFGGLLTIANYVETGKYPIEIIYNGTKLTDKGQFYVSVIKEGDVQA